MAISSKPIKKQATSKKDVPVEQVQFSEDEVKRVKEAIRRARQGMADWNKKAKVNPDKMRRPLTR